MPALPLGLYVAWVGLAAGAAGLFVLGVRAERHPWHHLLAFLVPLVTALAYTLMALGQGVAVLADGRVYFWARWADAPVSATLLVLNTALVALPRPTRERHVLFVGLFVAHAVTMLAGLLAGFLTDAGLRWAWYFVGAGAYAFALWMLAWRVPAEAAAQGASARRRRCYRRLLAVLVTVSLAYPLWWLATPAGFGLVGAGTGLNGFAALDLLSKPAYGLVLLRAVHALPDAREAPDARSA